MDTDAAFDLGSRAAEELRGAARLLFVSGSLLGPDRVEGRSPFGHGDDTLVALSMNCEIGADLISGSTSLLAAGNMYSTAALIRQMLEVEYLLWAFHDDRDDLDRWMRLPEKVSSGRRGSVEEFFQPVRLRQRAGSPFDDSHYSAHCTYGGHPHRQSRYLLREHSASKNSHHLILRELLFHSLGIIKSATSAIASVELQALVPNEIGVGLRNIVTELVAILPELRPNLPEQGRD